MLFTSTAYPSLAILPVHFRFDRDWKKIEAFVGTKTVIQVSRPLTVPPEIIAHYSNGSSGAKGDLYDQASFSVCDNATVMIASVADV